MSKKTKSELWLVLPDIHYPLHDRAAINAVLEFTESNRIRGVILSGDNLDCSNVSRHTKGKPRLRSRGGYQRDIDGFKRDILDPIESRLRKKATKVFFHGNHEDWLADFLDENPELEGALGIAENLQLKERGWKVIPCGGHYEVGRAMIVHGDQIGSGMHIAKKLVDSLCQIAIMGHVHTYSAYTKVSQVKERRKWIGITLPTLGTVAPSYAKGRPNAFVNGFGILETWGNGYVNVYVPIIVGGQFAFAGRVYGKAKRRAA
jgi:predicted phosphodiesterase